MTQNSVCSPDTQKYLPFARISDYPSQAAVCSLNRLPIPNAILHNYLHVGAIPIPTRILCTGSAALAQVPDVAHL